MICLHVNMSQPNDQGVMDCPLCGHHFIFAGDGSLQILSMFNGAASIRIAQLENELNNARVVDDAADILRIYEEIDRVQQQAK